MNGWWTTVDPATAPADAPAAFCADLTAESLLGAYRRGLFPLPTPDDYGRFINEARYEQQVTDGSIALPAGDGEHAYAVSWWSPDPRPVIPVHGTRLGSRLARRLRNSAWTTTADHAFARVVDLCAEDREPRWLTPDLRTALTDLHATGHAHSAEVWDGPELVGGVFGVRVGAVLSLDSMFRRRPDAARIAVADLAARFARAGGRHLDAQWDSPHIRTLGARPLPRDDYLALLHRGPDAAPPDPGPLPVARLGAAATPASRRGSRS
ncbi:leucyl/phenylalanyl-tRNA--protein transferase [Kitasatospora cinereorecta]|uniref:Leucyl/phenylalanyl-tRNA--protein transferase n=1 Tax=Kitasatospora cinereorecta TaxID=285560 RepID=A0ABW0VDU8_9ACTN